MSTNGRNTELHSRQSRGTSHAAIYRMVARTLAEKNVGGEVLLDVGCGVGALWDYVRDRFTRYVGVDALKYEGTPAELEFHRLDLDNGGVPLPDGCADVVASVETIEHLENPRAFARELVRLTRPGGWIIITTPNQLSALSLVTLLLRKRFSAFQDVLYPAHITALLEIDLVRIARECGLFEISVQYSKCGRIVLTPWHYPGFVAGLLPRVMSDNLLIVANKPVN